MKDALLSPDTGTPNRSPTNWLLPPQASSCEAVLLENGSYQEDTFVNFSGLDSQLQISRGLFSPI